MQTKIKSILQIILVAMLLLNGLMTNVSKVQAATPVSVKPSDQTVGQEGVLLPTSPFAINITVENVADLLGWQIVLYYNSTILSTKTSLITLPPGHVFDGKEIIQAGPFIEVDSKGTYIIFGAALKGGQSTFSGSGTLGQIKFTGQATGTSSLNLDITTEHGFYTKLRNSNNELIPVNIVNGQVTVVGAEKISINVAPATATIGSNVTVSGDIYVRSSDLNVTIFYRVAGNETWAELATVRTDANGHYIYPWNTSEVKANFYELRATCDYIGAESTKIPLTIKKASNITLTVSPKSVQKGSTVVIMGSIFEIDKNASTKIIVKVDVAILYKPIGEEEWHNLVTVKSGTGLASHTGDYVHPWATNETGTYEVKASWLGDKLIEGAESDVKTVEVTGAAPPQEAPLTAYLPYIIAAIAIIAIAAIGIYFTKIRKR